MKRHTFRLDAETEKLLKLIAEKIAGNNESFVVRKLIRESAQSLGIVVSESKQKRTNHKLAAVRSN